VSGPRPMTTPTRAGVRAASRQRCLRVIGGPAQRHRGSRTSRQRTRGARPRPRAHRPAVPGGSRSRHHRRNMCRPQADSRPSRSRLRRHRKHSSRPYDRPPRLRACGAHRRTTRRASRRPIQRFRRRCRHRQRFPGARPQVRCAKPRHPALRLVLRPRGVSARRPWPVPPSRGHRPVASGRLLPPGEPVDPARHPAADCHPFRASVR
jgi:hypothetical protein